MVVEAKPPIRRGTGVGSVIFVVAGLVLLAPLALIGCVLFYWIFAVRTETHYVPAQPAVYSYTMPSPYETVSSEFDARHSAANQIGDVTQRDEAFVILAANLSGNSQEANRAVMAIGDTALRDEAAWGAAQRFSTLNRPQESLDMINNMMDQKTRDAALRAVATGDWPERPGSIGTTEATHDAATGMPRMDSAADAVHSVGDASAAH